MLSKITRLLLCRNQFIGPLVANVLTGITLITVVSWRRSLEPPPSQFQIDSNTAFAAIEYMRKPTVPKNLYDPSGDAVKQFTCILGPSNSLQYDKILVSNEFWQAVIDTPKELYLYSAYLDKRSTQWFKNSEAVVQILGMAEETVGHTRFFCQFWATNTSRSVIAVTEAQTKEIWVKSWDPRTRFYVPVLFSCPIPKSGTVWRYDIPKYISLSKQPCVTTSNFLPVRHFEAATQGSASNLKKHTVVCVKGMDFLEDISKRLIEWLEATYMFGADKVVMYTYAVHPNIEKVLRFYEKLGRLDVQPLTLPGNMPDVPGYRTQYIKRNRQQKRRNELIPYNDCLYRHLYTHKFALIVDIDELIVPAKHSNWEDMLSQATTTYSALHDSWTSISVRNAFFFDNLTRVPSQDYGPLDMHMLQHPYRSEKISDPGNYGKSFVYIANALTVFNHFPLHKIRRNLQPTRYVPAELGVKNHYKAHCPIESRDECPLLYKDTVADFSLHAHKDKLVQSVESAIQHLADYS